MDVRVLGRPGPICATVAERPGAGSARGGLQRDRRQTKHVRYRARTSTACVDLSGATVSRALGRDHRSPRRRSAGMPT